MELDIKGAAEILGVSEGAVRRWIRTKKLSATKKYDVWFTAKQDIEEFIGYKLSMDDRLLSVRDICCELGVTRAAVSLWLLSGKLKGIKIGVSNGNADKRVWRIKEKDFREFLETRKRQ